MWKWYGVWYGACHAPVFVEYIKQLKQTNG